MLLGATPLTVREQVFDAVELLLSLTVTLPLTEPPLFGNTIIVFPDWYEPPFRL
jgi:hypothetical protein